MPAIQHLFVYGSLQPGCSNADVLAGLKGEWQPGTVIGQLFESGWGADLGYLGLKLTDSGTPVSGQVLTSPDLADFWAELDAFEGEQYRRVLARVTLASGETVDAFVYALR